jgi:GNAT superfamily N-acetyltransferase
VEPIEISTDRARLDIEVIHAFLQTSYRKRSVVERSIKNSLCFGVYVGGQQVAFARVVSDRAVFAYLMDVFVIPEYRGRGISKALMRAVLDHSALQTFGYFFLVCTMPTDSMNSLDFGRWRSPSAGCRSTIPTATNVPPDIGLEPAH